MFGLIRHVTSRPEVRRAMTEGWLGVYLIASHFIGRALYFIFLSHHVRGLDPHLQC
jgi:hypothetical protein